MAKTLTANDNATPLSAAARDWREGRRLRALELVADGYRPSHVARILGVSPGAVSQWTKRAKDGGGACALFKRKPRGRDARLAPAQLEELRNILAHPDAVASCSTRRVAEIIAKKWNIRYSRAHVSRILKALGIVGPRRGRLARSEDDAVIGRRSSL